MIDPFEMTTDYTGKCGNCRMVLGDDKYCRVCGTKRGEGAFEPYCAFYDIIYGPQPDKRTHKCEVCGCTWSTENMSDERYCPECGGKAPEISRENRIVSRLRVGK
ncbi:MAG: hypothetical protein LBC41_14670 [Clostridiales bacterium]|nr:hypothetical protein [Clostridiales bacterium]